jgi:diaminohydroxyphosphoribosylaminopyrimidine deaminase/5-amino-6-(5-phosphoribosylamino)uracil reductase
MNNSVTLGLDEALLSELLRELGREAKAFRFEVAPNPCVGAAALSGGRVLARGYHQSWGGVHAEVAALEAAHKADPKGKPDLLVVTLEPCSSEGKTGACTDAILAAKIPRVVVGELDPDPRHKGRGMEVLRAAGVEVFLLEGSAPLRDVSPQFLRWLQPERLRRPRPHLLAKWAQTRTGQLEPPEDIGDGRWISCEVSVQEVQRLRGKTDAILTGMGTVLADDPRLSVRAPGDPTHAPLRVVLDSYLRTPPEARLFDPVQSNEGLGELHILTIAGADAARWRALEKAGAQVHGLHGEGGDHVALAEALTWLWDRGVRRALLEAGPTLLQACLDRNFVDQVRIYTGEVSGGRGVSMGSWMQSAKLLERLDRESGQDAVIEAFLE